MSWPLVFQWPNALGSLLIWVLIFVFCLLVIDSYSKKIQLEIGYLETAAVLANKDEMEKIISRIVGLMIEHSEYIKQVARYGTAIWRL